jgi:hypothetical protein
MRGRLRTRIAMLLIVLVKHHINGGIGRPVGPSFGIPCSAARDEGGMVLERPHAGGDTPKPIAAWPSQLLMRIDQRDNFWRP